MDVSLTPEMEALILEKIKTGQYCSPSEVVRDAMRLLQEQDQVRQMRLEALRKDIAVGLEQEARGELVPLDAEWIKAEGRRRAKAGNR